MDWLKTIKVIEICLPVFGLIALGKIFQLKGVLQEHHRKFLNWLVYYFSLPALIYVNVSAQDPKSFQQPALIWGSLLPIVGTTLVFLALAFLLKLRGSFAAAFIFGAFYSNTAYIGFPLSEQAFGDVGLGTAAIVNALCVPSFMIIAFVLIGFFGAGERSESVLQRAKRIILNPFILACIFGAVTSLVLSGHTGEDGKLDLPFWALAGGGIIKSLLKLVAQMGLPLALLSIGSVLHLGTIRRSIGALSLDILGKLIIIPAFTYLCLVYLFPALGLASLQPEVLSTVVLIHALPNAVVSYVIACQIGVDEGFVSAQLVISTIVSAITIPVWIYILL